MRQRIVRPVVRLGGCVSADEVAAVQCGGELAGVVDVAFAEGGRGCVAVHVEQLVEGRPSPELIGRLRRKTLSLPVPVPTPESRAAYIDQLARLGASPEQIARLTGPRRRRRRLLH